MAMAIGAAFILAGLAGAGVHNLYMNKFRHFKGVLTTFLIGVTCAYFLTAFFIKLTNHVLAITFAGFLGFFELPLRYHDIAFMCEAAYPVSTLFFNEFSKLIKPKKGEALICGLSAIAYSIASVSVVLGTAAFFQDANASSIFIYGIATSAVLAGTTILSTFVKGTTFFVLLSQTKSKLKNFNRGFKKNRER